MTVTDFHTHILPALDHGSKSVSEAVLQLELIKGHGTDIAVATSHFYPHMHTVEAFVKKADTALEQLYSAEINAAPKLALGAEVLLCENLDTMAGLEQLCIRGTNVLLLELPIGKAGEMHFDTVEELISGGYTIVLAHIDRYLSSEKRTVDTLLEMGAIAQVNVGALFSHRMAKKLKKYLATDKICALGSDLHGVDGQAYKYFEKSQRLLGEGFGQIMARTEALLAGAELFDVAGK